MSVAQVLSKTFDGLNKHNRGRRAVVRLRIARSPPWNGIRKTKSKKKERERKRREWEKIKQQQQEEEKKSTSH